MLVKKIISSTLIALVIAVSTIVLSSSANAQTNTTPTTPTAATQSKRCTVAQGRLTTLITTFDAAKAKHTQAYGELITKFETRIDSAQKNGYDVTEMTKARDEAKAKIEVYTQKNTTLTTAVNGTKNLACGDSDSGFTTSLTSSRSALTETRTSAAAVRTAFTEGIIASLKDYALWLNQQSATGEDK